MSKHTPGPWKAHKFWGSWGVAAKMQHGWKNLCFMKEFAKLDCNTTYMLGSHLYNLENDSAVGEFTIYFNGIGMIMRTPIDYILAIRHTKKYICEKRIHIKKIHIWE